MQLKTLPEDFIVEEILNLNLEKERQDYSIARLTKKGWDHFKLIQKISKILNLKPKFIGYAGIKDKQAITTQYISFYKVSKEKINKIKIQDFSLEFLGYSKERINLGDLKGNNFKIIVRNLTKKVDIPKDIQIENYFDDQRFGKLNNTHLIGKSIIKKDFKETCKLLDLDVNKDYINEIQKQPKKLLKFYISAYQSYLWNETLKSIISKKEFTKKDYSIGELYFSNIKLKNFKLPLVSFDTKKQRELDRILEKEKITRSDFITRQFPDLVSESKERDALVNVKEIRSKYSEEDINKFKLELEFYLPKGSYATILIKKLSILIYN
ncbi:tRNA pseudouridine(13) synthase TruD [Candidatus Woesearchaeota archaeon]|nr:tRNA pseudouridine(13) synthase TruD [Candidatus Woesearchaeota archaeon]